jgi:putative ABC transport system permease protein
MLKNNLKIFLRNFFRNKVFSFITLAGLAFALTCIMVIMLFVRHEFSYDRFHHNPEQIYRVVKDFMNDDGKKIPDATTPPGLAPALKRDLPEVAFATRFFPDWGRKYLIQYKEKSFYELGVIRVDSSFFDVFDFPLVAGNSKNPFTGIHSILLTQSAARKYFGAEDPVGKVLRVNVNNGTDYSVTGVLKDVPPNAHFSFDFLIPLETQTNINNNWNWYSFYTYVRLKPNSNPSSFSTKLQPLFKKYQPESTNRYYAQSLTDIHLKSNLKWELGQNGDLRYIKILLSIALFVLLIAGVNYVNIVTARSAKRAKEVGIRKVTGALRSSLIGQFLTESILVSILSFIIAILATSLILPLTKKIFGYQLFLFPVDGTYLFFLLMVVFFIGLMAGLYPAFYLSSFQPARVLKANFFHSLRGIGLRQCLVVFQFLVSAVLIAGSLIISKQLQFIREKKLGFDQENILLLPNIRGTGNPELLVDDLKKIPGVKSIARADGVIAGENSTNGVKGKYQNNHISLNFMRVDYSFLPTMGIRLMEGRNFSKQFGNDSAGIVINEIAADQLGLRAPYTGQQILWDDSANMTHQVDIIGIAENFHFSSFHEPIKPFGFVLEVNNGSTFFIKINSKEFPKTISAIEKTWKGHYPDKPFEYAFQDEQVAKLHVSEKRFQQLFLYLTALAILIACLGLFGLATYVSESKTKEIGIRKILGSSVTQIIFLLSREFAILGLIAFGIAIPIAWYAMNQWLQNFAYRITFPWWVLVLTGAVTLTITFLTVSLQSFKAATANPAKSLKTE